MYVRLVGGALALVVGSAPLAADESAREERGPLSHHLVSAIDTRDFGAETVRIGDLNADGAPDLLFVQSVHATREITCLTATTILGEVLWQHGTPSRDNGVIYSDLPVQVYDWDGDGANEVLYVIQSRYIEPSEWGGWARERAEKYEGDAYMVVLDGATGAEKSRFVIPAPADDCFLFADLTGTGRRQDLVVKDRYWNIWGVSHEGAVLWHWEGSTGHFRPTATSIVMAGRGVPRLLPARPRWHGAVLSRSPGSSPGRGLRSAVDRWLVAAAVWQPWPALPGRRWQ